MKLRKTYKEIVYTSEGNAQIYFAIVTALVIFFTLTKHGYFTPKQAQAKFVDPQQTSNIAGNSAILQASHTPIDAPTVTPSGQEWVTSERIDIIHYIYTIFGPAQGRIACAVSIAESGLNPNAANHWQMGDSRGEYSIGLFQINLQTNDSKKVHYYQVPGVSLQEKIDWLQNPYNNTLAAFYIQSHAGWQAWTGYTSGNYENYLDQCAL